MRSPTQTPLSNADEENAAQNSFSNHSKQGPTYFQYVNLCKEPGGSEKALTDSTRNYPSEIMYLLH